MLNNEGLMYMFSPSTNNCKNGWQKKIK
jgi:hypothetical protein